MLALGKLSQQIVTVNGLCNVASGKNCGIVVYNCTIAFGKIDNIHFSDLIQFFQCIHLDQIKYCKTVNKNN